MKEEAAHAFAACDGYTSRDDAFLASDTGICAEVSM